MGSEAGKWPTVQWDESLPLLCLYEDLLCSAHGELEPGTGTWEVLNQGSDRPHNRTQVMPELDFMICWGLGDTNTGAAGAGWVSWWPDSKREGCRREFGLVLQKVKACLYPPAKGMEVWAEHVQGNSKITPTPHAQRLCSPTG